MINGLFDHIDSDKSNAIDLAELRSHLSSAQGGNNRHKDEQAGPDKHGDTAELVLDTLMGHLNSSKDRLIDIFNTWALCMDSNPRPWRACRRRVGEEHRHERKY